MAQTTRPILDYRRPDLGPRRWRLNLGKSLFELASLASAYIAYGLVADSWKPWELFLGCGMVLWIVVLAVSVLARRMRHPNFAIARGWRRAMRILLVMTVAWIGVSMRLQYYSCPHGRTWSNNLIGLSRSPNGGPCVLVLVSQRSGLVPGGTARGLRPRGLTDYTPPP